LPTTGPELTQQINENVIIEQTQENIMPQMEGMTRIENIPVRTLPNDYNI
jgi:hypothetical protein